MLAVLCKTVLKLYAFGLIIQAFSFFPYFVKAAQFQESGRDVKVRLLGCVTHAAPLGLLTIMMFTATVDVTRVNRKGIRLTFPEVLTLGAATVACFDKTGTLTGSVVRLLTFMLACLCIVNSMAGAPT